MKALVSLLPDNTEWSPAEFPHLTLAYADPVSDVNGMIAAAMELASSHFPFVLRSQGTEVFGDEEKVQVLLFELSTRLAYAQSLVAPWSTSQYGFRPHVTLGPQGDYGVLPSVVRFSRLNIKLHGEVSITLDLMR